MWVPLIFVALLCSAFTTCAKVVTQEIRMPNVTATRDDAYICHGEAMANYRQYLTHLKPIYSPATHHMLLFGCENPGSYSPSWDCGDIRGSKPVCNGDNRILYSWAMQAKEFSMPPNTSFPVGWDSFRYLVLQVHYKDAKTFNQLPNGVDNSGWLMTLQTEPTKYLAGIYLFAADGAIKPLATTVVQVSCLYGGTSTIHPVAFRVHAHSHGVMNDAYVYHDGQKYLIGAKSPQEDQTYYPVENKELIIRPNDVLVARCEMVNKEDRLIRMGPTREDEMCNFYMMYSVRAEDIDQLYDPRTVGCFKDSIEFPPEIDEDDELDEVYDVSRMGQHDFGDADWEYV